MKSVPILSVFCILFVWAVELSRGAGHFCDLVGTEDGLKSVVGCVTEHMPPFVIKLIEECYEEGFNETGSLTTYMTKDCLDEVHQEEFLAMGKCLEENSEEAMAASGFTEEEVKNASSETHECLKALVSEKDSSEELEEAIDEFVEEVDNAIEALK